MGDIFPHYQSGGGNCSICHSPNTNRLTCPLYADARNPDPLKYPFAEIILKERVKKAATVNEKKHIKEEIERIEKTKIQKEKEKMEKEIKEKEIKEKEIKEKEIKEKEIKEKEIKEKEIKEKEIKEKEIKEKEIKEKEIKKKRR